MFQHHCEMEYHAVNTVHQTNDLNKYETKEYQPENAIKITLDAALPSLIPPIIEIMIDYFPSLVLFCVTLIDCDGYSDLKKITLNIIDKKGNISPVKTLGENCVWARWEDLKQVLYDPEFRVMRMFGEDNGTIYDANYDNDKYNFVCKHVTFSCGDSPIMIDECRSSPLRNTPCVFRKKLYVVEQGYDCVATIKQNDPQTFPMNGCSTNHARRELCTTIVIPGDDALYLVGGDCRCDEDGNGVCTIERFDGVKCEIYGEYIFHDTTWSERSPIPFGSSINSTPVVVLCNGGESLMIVETFIHKNCSLRRSVVIFHLRTRKTERVGNLNQLYSDVRLFNLNDRIMCIGIGGDKLSALSEWSDICDALKAPLLPGFTMEMFDLRTKTWNIMCESVNPLNLGSCFVALNDFYL